MRLNILNGQPECDRRSEGSRFNQKTGILRAFTEIAQKATRQDYLHEAEHMRERVALLEQAITETSNRHRPRYNRSSTIYRHCAVSRTSRLLTEPFS